MRQVQTQSHQCRPRPLQFTALELPAVLWLNEKDLDIRCVRIKPYSYESQTLIDVQQVIPLPEATEYQVQVREKKRQERKARQGSADFTRYDVVVDDQVHLAQWKRNAILLAVKGIFGHGISPDDIAEIIEEGTVKLTDSRTYSAPWTLPKLLIPR